MQKVKDKRFGYKITIPIKMLFKVLLKRTVMQMQPRKRKIYLPHHDHYNALWQCKMLFRKVLL